MLFNSNQYQYITGGTDEGKPTRSDPLYNQYFYLDCFRQSVPAVKIYDKNSMLVATFFYLFQQSESSDTME